MKPIAGRGIKSNYSDLVRDVNVADGNFVLEFPQLLLSPEDLLLGFGQLTLQLHRVHQQVVVLPLQRRHLMQRLVPGENSEAHLHILSYRSGGPK